MLAASSSSHMISASPSLNSYSASNNTLAEVAARVVHELRLDEDPLSFEWYEDHEQPLPTDYYQQQDDEDNDFEFSFMCGNPESSSLVPADEIFHNGQIKPIYSVFAGDSSEDRRRIDDSEVVKKTTRRPQLRVLMGAVDGAEASSSCSSSEDDELDRIAPGTYCVWKPAAACKKSSSTGSSASSSRRWKLRQLLLKRSNSDGAKAAVLLAAKAVADGDGSGKVVESDAGVESSYHNNCRRKSFLPYRQDLVGFFANVNRPRRNYILFDDQLKRKKKMVDLGFV